jgi:esterase/lipase superfamily enzyme
MLFITNRVLQQGSVTVPGRDVSFDLDNNQAQQGVFFCERLSKNKYVELGSGAFLDRLKGSSYRQILLFLHGYSNLPEPHIFPRAETLQSLCDGEKANEVLVVPLIWPCDNDAGIVKDYYDDQLAADASGVAFARVLGKFLDWREKNLVNDDPCLKRMNILAHSMGNRVLRGAYATAVRYFCPGGLPMIMRNTFLVAADITNESLEPGQEGEHLPSTSRNVVVYFAADDMAMRASKVANVAKNTASRRLGHTGPENMDRVPKNVFAVDCDDVNSVYDRPKGHSYFLMDQTGKKPGRVFRHMWESMIKGRPPGLESDAARSVPI